MYFVHCVMLLWGCQLYNFLDNVCFLKCKRKNYLVELNYYFEAFTQFTNYLITFKLSWVNFSVENAAVVFLLVSLLICLKHIFKQHLPSIKLVNCSAAFLFFDCRDSGLNKFTYYKPVYK